MQDDLVRDLEQRIEKIEALDHEDLGGFNRLDWMICIVGAVLVPALLIWWYS